MRRTARPDFEEPEEAFAPVLEAIEAEAQKKALEQDPYEVVLQEARKRLAARFTPAQLENPNEAELRAAEEIVREVVASYQGAARVKGLPLLEDEEAAVKRILDEVFGYGPISALMEDEEVEEIIINGPKQIWVIDTKGKRLTPYAFRTARDVVNFVNRAAAWKGRKIDRRHPELNVKMRDGSRLHAIMEPLTDNVPIAVTIRKHRLVARTLEDLVRLGTINETVAEFLRYAVKGRLNIIVSGGTASGKTNFLNALSAEIDPEERVITVEDTPELQLVTIKDWVALVVRESTEDVEGIDQERLIRNTLRMRPDRIITGEARGPEIVPILEAANTGHDGQMLTIHANDPRHVVQRIETLYLKAGLDVPIKAIRREFVDAFQLIIHLRRIELPGGKTMRRCTHITEITGRMEGDVPELVTIFEDRGNGLAWTGNFPNKCLQVMQERAGIMLDFRSLVNGRR